ncbi:MAG: hypothetical protein QW594_01960 [Candidatus Woesearchaeota archaeon]
MNSNPRQQKLLAIALLLGIALLVSLSGCTKKEQQNLPESKSPANEPRIIHYKGYDFAYVDGLWTTALTKGNFLYPLRLQYNPNELEEIEILGDIHGFFPSNKTYIAYPPYQTQNNVGLALAELSTTLAPTFIFVQEEPFTPLLVCSHDGPQFCYGVNPLQEPLVPMNCTTHPHHKVIELKIDTVPYISVKNNNCIIIAGSTETIVQSVDRFLYALYGIMNPGK